MTPLEFLNAAVPPLFHPRGVVPKGGVTVGPTHAEAARNGTDCVMSNVGHRRCYDRPGANETLPGSVPVARDAKPMSTSAWPQQFNPQFAAQTPYWGKALR